MKEENWDSMKTNIHSSFLVMLHSVLAFPKKTAGEVAQEVIKIFEKYALPEIRAKAKQETWDKAIFAIEINEDIDKYRKELLTTALKQAKEKDI